MAKERVFDAAALEEYRQFLQELLDELENEVVPVFREGALGRAPAFGAAPEAAVNALPEYLRFRAATWRNLQYLRGTLHGLTAALEHVEEETSADDARAYWQFMGLADRGGTNENGGWAEWRSNRSL